MSSWVVPCYYCRGRGCLACRGTEIRRGISLEVARQWLMDKITTQLPNGELRIRYPANDQELTQMIAEAMDHGARMEQERAKLGEPSPPTTRDRFALLELGGNEDETKEGVDGIL